MSNTSIPQNPEQLNIEYHWDNFPEEPKALKQWVLWKLVINKSGRLTKIPYSLNGYKAKSTDPSTWDTFDKVVETYRSQPGEYSGIGFVFSENDDYVGTDIDKCIVNGVISDEARLIIQTQWTYTEVSPGGKGFHTISKAKMPTAKGWKNAKGEMYNRDRFFTITGNVPWELGTPLTIEENQQGLDTTFTLLFPKASEEQKSQTRSPQTYDLTDQVIIDIASNAKNGTKFIDLYRGEWNEWNYPSQSEADLAFCNQLSFYTKDFNQIDRIFSSSGLNREKWNRNDYKHKVINMALSGVAETYSGKAQSVKPIIIKQETERSEIDEEAFKAFNLTDLGNAERLVDYFEKYLLYCHLWSKWLVWDGKRWNVDENGGATRLARDTVRRSYAEATRYGTSKQRKALAKHSMLSESNNKIKGMLEIAKSLEGIPVNPEEMDTYHWLLNCENGTLDLKTGELLPHNPEHLITKLVPVPYNPDAKAPVWKEFLKHIMNDNQNMIRFLQKAVGYSLTGSTKEQVMFILHGSGANGKSTLVEALTSMLGEDYSRKTPTSTLMVRKHEVISNDVARLRGARLVSSVEGEEGQRLAESFIKQITGGDTITARFMRAEFFEFKPQLKLFLATNHKPEIRGTDHAIWRRIRLIPFLVTIPQNERDMDLSEKLLQELPGIFAWAVEGAKIYQEEGLGVPYEIKAATEQYRAEQDLIGEFIVEHCEIRLDATITNSNLYGAYKEHCLEMGEVFISQKAFTAKLKERGYEQKRRTAGVRTWSGIKIKQLV